MLLNCNYLISIINLDGGTRNYLVFLPLLVFLEATLLKFVMAQVAESHLLYHITPILLILLQTNLFLQFIGLKGNMSSEFYFD